VFVRADAYGGGHVPPAVIDTFAGRGFASVEVAVSFRPLSFLRQACRSEGMDVDADPALGPYRDLTDYEFPKEATNRKARDAFLKGVAGGVYWTKEATALRKGEKGLREAEEAVARGYRARLREKYPYVLELLLSPGPGELPENRLYHLTDRWEGSFAFAKAALDLPGLLQVEQQPHAADSRAAGAPAQGPSRDEISSLLLKQLRKHPAWTGITELLAGFMTDHGILCGFKAIYGILAELEKKGVIQIARLPEITGGGSRILFWEETKRRKVSLRAAY
jgi:hypothetical protein